MLIYYNYLGSVCTTPYNVISRSELRFLVYFRYRAFWTLQNTLNTQIKDTSDKSVLKMLDGIREALSLLERVKPPPVNHEAERASRKEAIKKALTTPEFDQAQAVVAPQDQASIRKVVRTASITSMDSQHSQDSTFSLTDGSAVAQEVSTHFLFSIPYSRRLRFIINQNQHMLIFFSCLCVILMHSILV